jgi:hypothetical protein
MNPPPFVAIDWYQVICFRHSAMAEPISCGESSWMKCNPGTVTLIVFFQPHKMSVSNGHFAAFNR